MNSKIFKSAALTFVVALCIVWTVTSVQRFDSAMSKDVRWEYKITNTDDRIHSIGSVHDKDFAPSTIICEKDALQPGESTTCFQDVRSAARMVLLRDTMALAIMAIWPLISLLKILRGKLSPPRPAR